MSHIYTGTIPIAGARETIEAYSDEALRGAMEQLRKADYLGKWGKDRLADLEAEARRRNMKRRDAIK